MTCIKSARIIAAVHQCFLRHFPPEQVSICKFHVGKFVHNWSVKPSLRWLFDAVCWHAWHEFGQGIGLWWSAAEWRTVHSICLTMVWHDCWKVVGWSWLLSQHFGWSCSFIMFEFLANIIAQSAKNWSRYYVFNCQKIGRRMQPKRCRLVHKGPVEHARFPLCVVQSSKLAPNHAMQQQSLRTGVTVRVTRTRTTRTLEGLSHACTHKLLITRYIQWVLRAVIHIELSVEKSCCNNQSHTLRVPYGASKFSDGKKWP